MDTLIFSQTSIFRMQQLASSIYHKTGVRHRLASPEGMLELLRAAGSAADSEIRTCYDAFVQSLNQRQLDMLAARKVKLRQASGISLISPIRQAG